MEKKEVQTIMKRIKQNYKEFIVDDYNVNEWYIELKEYEFNDVMRKLEEHLRSEKYGDKPPRVYFLTKYLTKIKDKNKKDGIVIRCSVCHKKILLNDFDKHFDRCSSVKYLNNQNKKYFDKEIDKDKYMNMSDKEFNYKYDKFCEYILENTRNKKEIECLENYFLRR